MRARKIGHVALACVLVALAAACAHGPRGSATQPRWREADTTEQGFQPVREKQSESLRYLRYAVRIRDADMRPLGEAHPRLVGYLKTGRVTAGQIAKLGGTHYRVLDQRDDAAYPWLSISAAQGCPLLMRQPSSSIPLAASMPLPTMVDPSGQSPCVYGESSRLPPERRLHHALVEVWLVAPERITDLPKALRPRPRSYL